MSDAQPGLAIQLAARMYSGIAAIGRDPTFQRVLAEDQYLFASYMSAINPVVAQVAIGLGERGTVRANSKPARLLKALTHGQSEKLSMNAVTAIDERHEALKMINELKNHMGSQLTAAYASMFIRFTEVFRYSQAGEIDDLNPSELIKLSSEVVLDYIDENGATFDQNLRWLSKLLDLNKAEANLITASTLTTVDPAVNIFFRYLEHAIPGRSDLMELLSIAVVFDHQAVFDDGVSVAEGVAQARRALDNEQSKPLAFGMVRYSQMSRRFGPMSQFWLSIMFKEFDDIDQLCDELLIEAKNKDSASGALARIDDPDKVLLDKLITAVKADPKLAKGANILAYGPKRFDKRTVILDSLEGKVDGVFELRQRGVSEADLPSVAWVAQERLRAKMKKDNKTYVLLIERAENVLSRSMKRNSLMFDLFGEDRSQPKGEDRTNLDSDEHLLTQGPSLTIWMTNYISQLADEAVGRFLSHIEVKGGTRADRKAEVQKVATELKLPDDLVQKLSQYTELGSHQVRSAASLVTLLGEQPPDSYARILAAVEASQKALDRNKTEEIRTSVTQYDLGLLNLSGKFNIEKIVKALAKKPSGTLCFYGLPGTGKTQLAEHIALAIDKPLLIKRASDIFGMYLGESEKNIARMFEEGKSEDAIILLDEGDSFMRDRKLAKAAWEVSIVNELLTRMERYPGVFILATNLFEQLDAAALRRFTFKLQFHSLNEQQRLKMFENETGVKVTVDLDNPIYQALAGIKYLTPGDFATVKRQAKMLDETLTPDDWLEQLAEECKAKMNGLQSMGLNQEDAFIVQQKGRHRDQE
jgi:hypothetical protein